MCAMVDVFTLVLKLQYEFALLPNVTGLLKSAGICDTSVQACLAHRIFRKVKDRGE